jgi:phosphohistidine phosphatase
LRLYLVQHGEAKSKEEDPDRSLSAKGSRDVSNMAAFLKNLNLRVSEIRQSGKTRAAQTADLLAMAVSSDAGIILSAGLSPNDPVRPLVEEVKGLKGDLMVVGHLPYMGKLAAALIAGSESIPVVAFQQGGVVCLERDEGDTWRVSWMVTPEILPSGA